MKTPAVARAPSIIHRHDHIATATRGRVSLDSISLTPCATRAVERDAAAAAAANHVRSAVIVVKAVTVRRERNAGWEKAL